MPAEREGKAAGRRRGPVVLLLATANLFVLAFSAYTLSESRQQHELRAQTYTQNLTQAVDASVSNSIEKIDLALKAVGDELQHELAGTGLDSAAIATMLSRYEERLPEVDAIRISDAQGRVLYGKGVDPKNPASWADREYFPLLRDNPDAGLHVSRPRIGRVAKKPIVGFERRYNRPDGSFGGVVSAPIPLEHFNQLLSRFDIEGRSRLVLRDANLAQIARHPPVGGPAGAPGSAIVSDRLQELVRSGVQTATYDAVLPSDQRVWTFTYRRISAAPMIVLAGLAKDDYLAAWYAEMQKTLGSAGAFLLLSLLSGWFVLRQQARIEAESARNQLYLRHACDGIHILDNAGNLLQASDQFCAMLGYDRHDLLGKNMTFWEEGWSAKSLRDSIIPEWLALDAPTVFDTVFRSRYGEPIDVEVHLAPFEMEGKRCLFATARDIRERKRQQLALIDSENRRRQSEERYRLLLQNSPLGILHYDRNLLVTYANERFEEIMQVPRGHMLGLDCSKLSDQSVAPVMRRAVEGVVAHYEGPYTTSYSQLHLWISMHCGPVRDASGQILGGVVIVEDITERKRIEEEQERQRAEHALAASVFTHAHEGIIICDANQVILDVNPTFTEITGYAHDEIVGHTPRFLASGLQDAAFYKAMWETIHEQGHWEGEVWNRRKDGSIFAERLTISSVVNDRNEVTHYIGTFSDISLIKRHQDELERLAHYDPLTNLPNRALLYDRMAQALAQARRSGNIVTVCYLDLDGFKAINDELGHEAGDTVLIEVGRRLRSMLREADTVARLGGDEFVILLNGLESVVECENITSRALDAIAAPIRIGELERGVSASIGIALFPADGGDADTLLRRADHAMYMAKQSGKNRHVYFGSSSEDPPAPIQESALPVD